MELKARHRLWAAAALAELIAAEGSQELFLDVSRAGSCAGLVPIPSQPQRLKERGFNPVIEIGAELAARTGVPLHRRALLATGIVRPQSELNSAKSRSENVRGAFRAGACVPPIALLLDDVLTTGATLREAASTLKAAGAERVVAVCAARAVTADLRGER
ncbi:MAG: hypothetical protein AAF458_12285 [Pseudomonadota bacterium]